MGCPLSRVFIQHGSGCCLRYRLPGSPTQRKRPCLRRLLKLGWRFKRILQACLRLENRQPRQKRKNAKCQTVVFMAAHRLLGGDAKIAGRRKGEADPLGAREVLYRARATTPGTAQQLVRGSRDEHEADDGKHTTPGSFRRPRTKRACARGACCPCAHVAPRSPTSTPARGQMGRLVNQNARHACIDRRHDIRVEKQHLADFLFQLPRFDRIVAEGNAEPTCGDGVGEDQAGLALLLVNMLQAKLARRSVRWESGGLGEREREPRQACRPVSKIDIVRRAGSVCVPRNLA